jgi:SAM-dependent methyltransferase
VRDDLFDLHAAIEAQHWWFRGRREIVRAVLRQVVAPGTGRLVLDVGCGTGATAAALSTEYAVVGVDSSASAIGWAERTYAGLRFVTGRVPDSVPDESAQASAYLLMDVAEHVPDDFLLISTLLAALRPGGHLLMTVPADETLWSEHDVSFGHFRRYDPSRLRQTWEGLPVTVRLVSYFNARLYPAVRTIRTLNRWAGRALGDQRTDFRLPVRPVNDLLTSIFAAEATRLRRAIDAPAVDGALAVPSYRRGVSIMAVLRREAGPITPRSRPGHVPADRHGP